MRAQTRLHFDSTAWQLLKRRYRRKPLDHLAHNKLAIAIKVSQLKHISINVDAKRKRLRKIVLGHARLVNVRFQPDIGWHLFIWGAVGNYIGRCLKCWASP